jgi:PadR family transcriptional regulator AphA
MSLRHAMLALLTAEPMTGYDIAEHFNEAVAFLWAAPHSQIYPELRRMETEGLVQAEEVLRGGRATKRRYSISDEGRAALERWMTDSEGYPAERNAHRLKAAYFELTDFSVAREHLAAHIRHYNRRLDQWRETAEAIRSRRHPLLLLRLEKAPPELHDVIVAYKALAFDGEAARARAEIEWAQRGIELVDELEAKQKVNTQA